MTREEKAAKVEELEGILGSAKGIYLADYRGMTVEVVSELRKRCRESDIHFEVVKNTLLRRAAKSSGSEGLAALAVGPIAIATSETDEVAPARVLVDFAKEFKLPEMKGGYVDGQAIGMEEAQAISKLPPREILLGNLLRAMQGPLTNFVSVLQAPLRDLASVLEQVAKQKGEGSAA
ncbi:MAG: 50S ribosomal protein L10 [Candidatus Eisenbacteria bacterium]|nr:50S ribosomal protein L10 [Candidatus Eisenbacteria bacterium]